MIRDRATSFFYFSAVVLTAEIVATPISGLTMTENPWLPFLLSSGVEFLAVIVALLFAPETLPSTKAPLSSINVENEGTPSNKEEMSFVRTIVARISNSFALIKESTHFLSTNLNVSLLLLVFFVATLSRQAMALLLQYATKKYHWSYSKVLHPLLITLRRSLTCQPGHYSSLNPRSRQSCSRSCHPTLSFPPSTPASETRRPKKRSLAIARHRIATHNRHANNVLCPSSSHLDYRSCGRRSWLTTPSHCAKSHYLARPTQPSRCFVYFASRCAVRGYTDCRAATCQHIPLGHEIGGYLVRASVSRGFGDVFTIFSAY